MGYYTNFTLEIQSDQGRYLSLDEIKEELVKHMKYDPFVEGCKWYDNENDMNWLSKKYGGTVFKLIGQGEDNEDMWIKYFLNGKVQICKAQITYDEYSPKKLR